MDVLSLVVSFIIISGLQVMPVCSDPHLASLYTLMYTRLRPPAEDQNTCPATPTFNTTQPLLGKYSLGLTLKVH